MIIRPWPIVAALLVLPPSSEVAARTWDVPSEIPTIQAAIDSAVSSDTVTVAPGTYHERLTITSKNLTLLGTGGAENTILSGALLSGDSLSILSLELVDSTTLVTGFTFQDNGNDSADYTYGGGIDCFHDAFPKIVNNVFRNNFATGAEALAAAGARA